MFPYSIDFHGPDTSKMCLKRLFLIISIIAVVAWTSQVPENKTCPCPEGECENGICFYDCVSILICDCTKGWAGDSCDQECKLDCNEGECYLDNQNKEKCIQSLPESKHKFDKRWLILFIATPVMMLCCFALVLYQLWRRRVLFAMRIVHYFQWENNDEHKEYDAFISYRASCEDEPWVLRLHDKLEKEMGFRVCIHLRDFLAGEFIAYNIINAIEKSRRTILVISPDYVTGEWTRMEYQQAQQEMLKLRHKIIPIMFRDVNGLNSMDKNLTYILRTVTYIKWPGDTDTKGQQRFWEQLKLTMPKRKLACETPEGECGVGMSFNRIDQRDVGTCEERGSLKG